MLWSAMVWSAMLWSARRGRRGHVRPRPSGQSRPATGVTSGQGRSQQRGTFAPARQQVFDLLVKHGSAPAVTAGHSRPQPVMAGGTFAPLCGIKSLTFWSSTGRLQEASAPARRRSGWRPAWAGHVRLGPARAGFKRSRPARAGFKRGRSPPLSNNNSLTLFKSNLGRHGHGRHVHSQPATARGAVRPHCPRPATAGHSSRGDVRPHCPTIL